MIKFRLWIKAWASNSKIKGNFSPCVWGQWWCNTQRWIWNNLYIKKKQSAHLIFPCFWWQCCCHESSKDCDTAYVYRSQKRSTSSWQPDCICFFKRILRSLSTKAYFRGSRFYHQRDHMKPQINSKISMGNHDKLFNSIILHAYSKPLQIKKAEAKKVWLVGSEVVMRKNGIKYKFIYKEIAETNTW